jgi:hypothetical protein
MIVAYYFPHNDGMEYGVLDKPGQDTGTSLVDLYEVDGAIRTFDDRPEAETWLRTRSPHIPNDGSTIGTHVHIDL